MSENVRIVMGEGGRAGKHPPSRKPNFLSMDFAQCDFTEHTVFTSF